MRLLRARSRSDNLCSASLLRARARAPRLPATTASSHGRLFHPSSRALRSNLLDLTQFAFRSCVHSFLHHEITAREQKCIDAVTKKYVATSVRATSRLSESQAVAAALDRTEAERTLTAAREAAGLQ